MPAVGFFERDVFIKQRNREIEQFKALSKECNQSLSVDHMTDPGHNMKRVYFKILANQNEEESLHSWVKVDQAVKPLLPEWLSILKA